jgi:hypothetical protein
MTKIDRNVPSVPLSPQEPPAPNTTQNHDVKLPQVTQNEKDQASQLADDAKNILDTGARFVRNTLNAAIDSVAHGCPSCPHQPASPADSKVTPNQAAPDTLINSKPAPKVNGQ